MSDVTLEIPFTSLSYVYTALPEGYPVQPYVAQQFQPVVYTESKGQSGYLTVLLSLPGNLLVSLPESMQVETNGEDEIYAFHIHLTYNENLEENGRMVMISVGVDFPDSIAMNGKWEVVVAAPVYEGLVTAFGSKIVGKVVMDSNIYPT